MTNFFFCIIPSLLIFSFALQINGIRLELTKTEDIEVLGKLIYGTFEKTDLTKIQVDAYRYLLILMKAVIGINTFTADK